VGRKPDLESAVLLNNWYIDHDYISTMGMEIINGRDFDLSISTDSQAVVINERLAQHFEGNPVGQILSNVGENPNEIEFYEVIGVVKDFNFESLRENIEPLAFFIAGWGGGSMTMKLNADDPSGFLSDMQSLWNEMAPSQPFSYAFMDDRFDRMYDYERRIGNVIGAFAFMAILIACIGLVGLSTFVAQQRTKEIGVRKVLGASTANLVGLLAKDFLRLVVVALLLAMPLSWWAMSQWLQGFAYRIEMGYGVFVAAGAIALLVAFLTVSFQSVRAALANPVKSLQSE
jgi:putative ABC transport system permease protein